MSTGNTERDKLLIDAIKRVKAVGKTPSLKLVARQLPDDFDLLEEELIDAMADLHALDRVAPTDRITESVAEAPADVAEGDSETSPQAPRDAPVISQAQARAAVEAAHKRLGAARIAVRLLQQKRIDTRARLAACIEAWRHDDDPLTPEQRQAREHRAYLASELARKQGLADAGQRPNRMLTDKFRLDMQTGTGVYKGGSRGAMSEGQRARYGFVVPGSPAAQAQTIARDKIRGEK